MYEKKLDLIIFKNQIVFVDFVKSYFKKASLVRIAARN